MTALFLFLTFLLVYVAVGYPLSLVVLARLFPRKHAVDASAQRSVTLIISAYNEEGVIGEKIKNSLALAYPAEKLQIVVVSDASTDATDDIVRAHADRGVVLIRTEGRLGKTAGLNRALAGIESDIVVFTDANAMYEPDAVARLVRHFGDDRVGYAVGWARYRPDESSAGKSETSYWALEIGLKKWESEVGSVVGGDGAIYAIRRELYEPLETTDINDFVNPLQIVAQGYRGVFDASARCNEGTAGGFGKEFRRKVRIVNRSFNGVLRVPQALNPLRVGLFAWQLISHKLLRWLVPFLAGAHFLTALFVPPNSWVGTAAGLSIAAYGLWASLVLLCHGREGRGANSPKLLYFPYYLALVAVASAAGVWLRCRGVIITTWETARTVGESDSATFMGWVFAPVLALSVGRLAIVFLGVRLFAISGVCMLSVLLVYTYLGYPAALWLWLKAGGGSPVCKDEQQMPSVTLLVVAFNEESVIEAKVRNCLELEYPADHLQIVVASDGSTDRTTDLLAPYQTRGVRVLAFPENRGKTSALNDAMKGVDTDIVVFSDANVMYAPNALEKLVENFGDSRVGAVSGKVVLQNDEVSYGISEQRYYSIEHFIQWAEGETGGMVGADGAMYAVRRNLFQAPPTDTILDDLVIPMGVSRQGFRVVHEAQARGYERNVQEIRGEFRRKARIVAGGVQCILDGRGLPPRGNPLLVFKFFSHKVLRWASGAVLLGLYGLMAALHLVGAADQGALWLYKWALAVALGLGISGQLFPTLRGFRWVNLVHYGFMLSLATLMGSSRGLFGRQRVTWKT